jgi:hypothetical protein
MLRGIKLVWERIGREVEENLCFHSMPNSKISSAVKAIEIGISHK